MNSSTLSHRHPFFVACVLAGAFWLLDAGVEALLFGTARFGDALWRPDPEEVWMRAVVMAVTLAFGLHLQRSLARAEKAARTVDESEARYRNLVETAQDLIWRCDAEGRFTYLNPAWESTHGYRIPEMLGRPFTDFEAGEVRPADLEEFQRHLEGGSVRGYETVHLAKDGTPIHLVFNAIPLRNSEGDIVGTQGTAHDISERRVAQAELLRSTQILEEMGRQARIGGWELTIPEMEPYLTDETRRIYGFSSGEEDFDLDTGVERYPEEVRGKVLEAVTDALQYGTPYDLTVPFVTVQGERIWIRTTGRAIQDETGTTTKLVGSFQPGSCNGRRSDGDLGV